MDIRNIAPFLLGTVFMAAPQAKADTRDEVIAGIGRCGVIHDDHVWLDCVYGANQPMRSKLGLQPAPEFQQRLVPPAQMNSAPPPVRTASQPAPRKKPGFFENLLGQAPPLAVSRMASYRYDKNGGFIVTLENGQEWRQVDVDSGTASWTRAPSAYTVTVTQGALANYNLRTSDNPRLYQVEPVK